MTNDVLVFAEIRDGQLKKINAEVVTAAAKIAGKSGGAVDIALLGNAVDKAVEQAAVLPVRSVLMMHAGTVKRSLREKDAWREDASAALPATAFTEYRNNLLRECGDPTDPLEIMMIEQLAMEYRKLAASIVGY